MGRPTILRIPEGIELLPEMEEKLKSLIGDFDLPEKFGEDNRIIDAMFERMQALQNGFKFLLGAYDEPLFHLDDCASRVRHILKKQLDDEDNAEQLLRRYAHILIDVLVWKLNITPQEALHQLNRAEQYYLMTQVRPVVATLSLCNENSTRFMLQCDTPKKAFAEETIRELKHISAFADEYGTSQPDLPHWFQKLKPEFRAFILLAKSSGYKRDDLVFLLKELVRMWQENQTVMTDKTYQFISNFSLTRNKKILPEWLANYPECIILLLSDCFQKNLTPDQLISLIDPIRKHGLPETYDLPPWYYFLEDFEKRLLVQSLKIIDDLHLVSLCSRLRSLPGIANYAMHDIYLLDHKGIILEQFKSRERFAHQVSRLIFKWPISLQSLYIRRNLSMLSQDSQMIMTTLVSPDKHALTNALKSLFPVVADFIDALHPDTRLQALLEQAIKYDPNITLINLPVNYYGGWFPWQKDLTSQIAKFKKNEHLKDLLPLMEDAERLLNKEVKHVPWNSVNLHLAAIFQLIGQKLGESNPDNKTGSIGSCVSGKDRYAVLLSYASAMKTIRFETGKWPMFECGNNAELNGMIMRMLKTNHQQTLANWNAKGAMGLKNLEDYLRSLLPMDDSGWSAEQNLMASNNEVPVIVGSGTGVPGNGYRFFLSVHLGNSMCKEINRQIHAIVQEKQFWVSQGSRGMPTGISDIREQFRLHPSSSKGALDWFSIWSLPSKKGHLSSSNPTFSSEMILANVLETVNRSLLRTGVGRSRQTQVFYDILKPLTDYDALENAEKTAKTVLSRLSSYFEEIKERYGSESSEESPSKHRYFA